MAETQSGKSDGRGRRRVVIGPEEMAEEYRSQYPLFFRRPAELIEELNHIEAQNLQLIVQIDRNDQLFKESRHAVELILSSSQAKIDRLEIDKRDLKTRVKETELSIERLQRRMEKYQAPETESDFAEALKTLQKIAQIFKAKSDKGSLTEIRAEANPKAAMLQHLKVVEKLVFKMEAEMHAMSNRELINRVTSTETDCPQQ